MELQNWFKDAADHLGQGFDVLSRHYNRLAASAQESRTRTMDMIVECAPGMADILQKIDRAHKVIQHGIQKGVVEIGAGMVGMGGDMVLNGGYKLLADENLFAGSAENWTRRNLHKAIDAIEEVSSLGANKPLTDMTRMEKDITDILSIATQLAMPAATVAGGISKGYHLGKTARAAQIAQPAKGFLQSFFDDAVHFSQHPWRSLQEALSFGSSTNNSMQLTYQLGEEGLQLAR